MLYILGTQISTACDILEIIDNTLADGYVPGGHIRTILGQNTSTVESVFLALVNGRVLTSRTGPSGGYKRLRSLNARELCEIFGVRFEPPDKPEEERTRADRVQMALLDTLSGINV